MSCPALPTLRQHQQATQQANQTPTCAFFPAPALGGLPAPPGAAAAFLCPGPAALLEEAWPCALGLLMRWCCMRLRLIMRVASSRKESRGPEQNWSSSDKLAAGARSRGRGLRMVEDAMADEMRKRGGHGLSSCLLLLLPINLCCEVWQGKRRAVSGGEVV